MSKKQKYENGVYITDAEGTRYYCCGNTRFKIVEHFAQNGKRHEELLMELVANQVNYAKPTID